ncbi:MAG: hypothetical protein BWY28_03023 [bacterium ADurb.Bin236]|nr:MAG: hypothetical protein BWY28_03023 [bacterium ADurb.Bin236]
MSHGYCSPASPQSPCVEVTLPAGPNLQYLSPNTFEASLYRLLASKYNASILLSHFAQFTLGISILTGRCTYTMS